MVCNFHFHRKRQRVLILSSEHAKEQLLKKAKIYLRRLSVLSQKIVNSEVIRFVYEILYFIFNTNYYKFCFFDHI